jgi:hypothetical protein
MSPTMAMIIMLFLRETEIYVKRVDERRKCKKEERKKQRKCVKKSS